MKRRTVLVVDDQMINRKILKKILQDEYEVILAENGKEALDILQNNLDISAVLLDIVMPVMDGYEVLQYMSSHSELSKIPVIVSSQKDGDEAEIKALEYGAYDFMSKPYKPDIIRHRLKNMIRFRETAAMINRTEKDELTGLYNKQFFMARVNDIELDHPDILFDIICVGIEKFKLVNDTYGVKKGDEVLQHIGNLLKERADTFGIAGRFSADEFYVLLPHEKVSENNLIQFYQKVNEFPIPMKIVLHFGLYRITDKELPVSAMCDRAKLAADHDRGKYDEYYAIYDDAMRKTLLEEQYITSQMQTAIDEKQFQVYYQPKYDLQNEKVAGAEALVRWIHPERGFLSPGAFIPIFEKNGFISQLDHYVWECVCEHMHLWISEGNEPVSISINVSRTDIYDPNLVNDILGLVKKYEIPKKYLHLEITESAYTDNSDQLIAVVTELRNQGFIIEMDDFGSGYSSLNMLAEMPVDILKLDMKFAEMEAKNDSGKGIMNFVISLAKWLNLTVIAEGVETGEQINDLRQMDCNYVQGFYYAKPMPLDQFEQLLNGADITEMLSREAKEDMSYQVIHKEKHEASYREMLIVDDIELNRAVLAAAFMDDYTIIEKENGKEALDYILENHENIDVVLLDLLMPVMDGFEVLKRIRTSYALRYLPVIVTSQGNDQSERRALKLGADDFIAKPYKIDLISHRVNNVIHSNKYLRLIEE